MFLRTDHPRKTIPFAALVPNFLTTLALCCGLASLHFALHERWERALAAIVLSGIFDVLDGGAARLLRVSSRFGAVLDSLSDFLAFGIAPAVILHQFILARPSAVKAIDGLSIVAVMLFALCSAMRLARFTAGIPAATPVPTAAKPANPKQRPGRYFTGMPTPAGAGAALIPAFLAVSDHAREIFPKWSIPEWVIALYIIIIALLMVSRLPMFALKGVRFSRGGVVPAMLVIGFLAAMMMVDPWLTLAGLAAVYLALIPVAWFLKKRAPVMVSAADQTQTSPVP